jgi:putative transcriptional regulator
MSEYNYNCIKELLAKNGQSNIELAAYVGVSVISVSHWCTNKKQPGVEKLFVIAEFLKVEARDLLTVRKDLKELKRKPAKGRSLPGKQKKGL